MATFEELRGKFSDDGLRHRVEIAVMIAALDLLSGAPTADDERWAAAVFAAPEAEGLKAFRGVLASNASASVAQITNVTDVAIQNSVNLLVPAFVSAFAALV